MSNMTHEEKLHLKTNDPMARQGEKEVEDDGISPMSPPEAFEPPAKEAIAYDEMHPFLQRLYDEHEPFKKVIDGLESALKDIKEGTMTREKDKLVRDFFEFFDQEFISHNLKEEKILFALLHNRLLESGEHSKGEVPQTAVDVLEGDHRTAIQKSAVVFNLLSIFHRLPDKSSSLMILDLALSQGFELVEELRLHIFREENVVFPLAHKLIRRDEFEAMEMKEKSGFC
ncbi:MAG: hemerythrin domain-containing protein [Bdellovibrionaceae bacterium]|nr:hemerythrin domain-containing protein [Bdellovibrionales bacterium]MCB9083458.1 hemerythrin domain-containing protein [Pseudobdellovibrionaceae bacterium]